MSNLAIKQATYQDIVDLPDNIVGEIINGQLETHPRPAPKHAVASSSLGAELVSPFQKGKDDPGSWWIIDEPECYLSVHILVPDLAVVVNKECLYFLKPIGLMGFLTGFVKFYHPQLHALTELLKRSFMHSWGLSTCG